MSLFPCDLYLRLPACVIVPKAVSKVYFCICTCDMLLPSSLKIINVVCQYITKTPFSWKIWEYNFKVSEFNHTGTLFN